MTEVEYNMKLWGEYVKGTELVDEGRKDSLIRMGNHFVHGNTEFLYKMYYAICEEERFCIEEDIELAYEKVEEDYLLRYQGETCIFCESEIRKIIADMIGIFEHILPLGSVVDLKKEFMEELLPAESVEYIRVVVTHRFVGEGPGGLYYPYAATLYPIGIPGSEREIEFTPALIKKVVYEGYSDGQEQAYIYLMKQELLLEKGMKSIGMANESERTIYIQKRKEEMRNAQYIRA